MLNLMKPVTPSLWKKLVKLSSFWLEILYQNRLSSFFVTATSALFSKIKLFSISIIILNVVTILTAQLFSSKWNGCILQNSVAMPFVNTWILCLNTYVEPALFSSMNSLKYNFPLHFTKLIRLAIKMVLFLRLFEKAWCVSMLGWFVLFLV